MSDDVPQGWIACTLGDVVKVQNGFAFPSNQFQKRGVPVIRQSNLNGTKVSLGKCAYLDPKWLKTKPDFVLSKNDVLIGMSGSVGKLCIYDLSQPALQNQRTGKIVPRSIEFVEWRFVWEYLKTVEQQLLKKGKGMGVLNVSGGDIESLPFRLAPLNEQRRIVAKLEKLMSRVDLAQARLAMILRTLHRFRRSLLKAGFKRQSEKNLKRLDEIFSVQTGGTPDRKNPEFFNEGAIPWVKTGEVRNRDIYQSEEFITEEGLNKSNAKMFPPGTLLIAMYGEGKTRGQVGRLRIQAATNQACAALVNPKLSDTSNQYVFLFLLSQYHKIRAEAVGGNQPNLNLSMIKSWEVPFPSLAEQQEIVSRVETLFKAADALEARYLKAKAHVDKLTQSILAKAFRGELVHQDPNDEPASVLLARISQVGAQSERKPKRARNQAAPAASLK
jgi:type I restriction enzyme, S subunit